MSRMIATDEASRTPVAMNGAALGSDTIRTVARPENPNARLVSLATGSTSSRPAIVLYRTGQIAPYTISVTDIRSPGPSQRLTSRISATEGIGRRNSTTARGAPRTPGRLPSSTPTGTPMITVTASPAAQASTVAPRSARNRPLPSSVTAWPSTVEVSGSTDFGMTPITPSTSATARNTITPVSPRRQRAARAFRAGDAGAACEGAASAAVLELLTQEPYLNSSELAVAEPASRPPLFIRLITLVSSAGSSELG